MFHYNVYVFMHTHMHHDMHTHIRGRPVESGPPSAMAV